MISPGQLVSVLRGRGVDFFTGVPDSYLKGLSSYLSLTLPPDSHIIAADEGNGVGLAIGHYLATARPAVVYMQNSGLGNAVNPLTSLADREVYGVPMLLIIGWRGEPGRHDEPQHIKQGRITPGLLELLEIPFRVLDENSDIEEALDQLWPRMMTTGQPAALLVKGGALAEIADEALKTGRCGLSRETALERLLDACRDDDCLVATTGKTGRELFELRVRRQEKPVDFLTVGGMGHASSIALAAALASPGRRLICLDGDGALIMHLGALGIIGSLRPPNFLHVLLNNHCHESVGGQPTCATAIDFAALARACGYAAYHLATEATEIDQALAALKAQPGPHFLEIILEPGARPDLGRPTASPRQNRAQFMERLRRP
ncbi:MAG: phosphonopyruvate decarboxylase [Candidatus Adiutrix sp.]|jgi:phosphonopyruvate decarboxylase|nr:phosphonopyruvate decarboxylase [Candidatus Adiutrix sp.]